MKLQLHLTQRAIPNVIVSEVPNIYELKRKDY